MLDFVTIERRYKSNGSYNLYPEFHTNDNGEDLMIRGGAFYAVWDEETGLWSTNEKTIQKIIDREIMKVFNSDPNRPKMDLLDDFSSGQWEIWRRYSKSLPDKYIELDSNVTFANTPVKKEDYVSKKLKYSLKKGQIDAYEELISTLYDKPEREKLEWAIGSIIAGDSKDIQKFIVLYGTRGSGKSTVLNIIQKLFNGYYSMFDAQSLASRNESFALEAFKENPLVAIQHDGNLSKIEDNSRLNSIVSHEQMLVNVKHKTQYVSKFHSFLFMGTNEPVHITNAKSGLIRRLIDVSPSERLVSFDRYCQLMKQIEFELGAIAYRCLEVYKEKGKDYYNSYMPLSMMSATNDFYDFMEDKFDIFVEEDHVALQDAWRMYKQYVEDAKVPYPYPLRRFKEELKNYFNYFFERKMVGGMTYRNYYIGFKQERFVNAKPEKEEKIETDSWIKLESQESLFDILAADYPAQYAAGKDEIPSKKWAENQLTLKDISTDRTHYVKVPENHIVIDFDLKNEEHQKDIKLNLEAASKFPKTYVEVSKGGQGLHLHYLYSGDPKELSRIYDENIEIKVFTGGSSLRRRLSLCNDIPIATIFSGLPIKKEVRKTINEECLKNEKAIRTFILRAINKEYHNDTSSSINFIASELEKAYNSKLPYDVSDLKEDLIAFASNSTHQANRCLEVVSKMKLKSEDESAYISYNIGDEFVFFDIEIFPNLFIVGFKTTGKEPIMWINPTISQVSWLVKDHKLIGFNNLRYDNIIIYAYLCGYTIPGLYSLSKKIINNTKFSEFREAKNISFTDIYDFASAGNKKSLKKLEIEMGIHHKELGLPWDQPVDKSLWQMVADYCKNDVIATEKAFYYLSADFNAREILSKMANSNCNDSTNSLTTKIIFGNNRNPHSQFFYRDLSKPVFENDIPKDVLEFLKKAKPKMMVQRHGEAKSLLPYFPGYKYEFGKSIYKGIDVGSGGFVYAEPGIYYNVALLDIASMHPNSTISECHFGVEYTSRFKDIVDSRVNIKHEDWTAVRSMLGGILSPFVDEIDQGKMTAKELSTALKTPINSVYGLTSASFDNPFRDPRNIDNLVAKRGALFMVDLKEEVQKRGFTVAHIKTDSIKIPNATPEIIQFVMDFGEKYGYTFEHEATYDRMCLVNDAVYIAYHDGKWDATGTQFAVPYVFKTLFSKEPIEFSDLCETKSVTTALYLDMNESLPEGEHDLHFVGKVGQFTPVKCGGGVLLREKDGKYSAATGTKGYRWLESETIYGDKSNVDISYYNALVDKAVDTISKFGTFERFVDIDIPELPF